VKSGTRDRNDATAIFQGYRVLKDLIELERRVKETDQLAAELKQLQEELTCAALRCSCAHPTIICLRVRFLLLPHGVLPHSPAILLP